jgi:molybdopterin converting factor small subunit
MRFLIFQMLKRPLPFHPKFFPAAVKFSTWFSANQNVILAKDALLADKDRRLEEKDERLLENTAANIALLAEKDKRLAEKDERLAEKDAVYKKSIADLDFSRKSLDARFVMERFELLMKGKGSRLEKWKDYLAKHPEIHSKFKDCANDVIWPHKAQEIYSDLSTDIHYSSRVGNGNYIVKITKGIFYSLLLNL